MWTATEAVELTQVCHKPSTGKHFCLQSYQVRCLILLHYMVKYIPILFQDTLSLWSDTTSTSFMEVWLSDTLMTLTSTCPWPRVLCPQTDLSSKVCAETTTAITKMTCICWEAIVLPLLLLMATPMLLPLSLDQWVFTLCLWERSWP